MQGHLLRVGGRVSLSALCFVAEHLLQIENGVAQFFGWRSVSIQRKNDIANDLRNISVNGSEWDVWCEGFVGDVLHHLTRQFYGKVGCFRCKRCNTPSITLQGMPNCST